ncbi:FMN-binding protein [Glaciihabitans sp. INWT7]|uniref:FMN-binding protein n=1 Tax=Glaciihabitans sp. INWT7 TaxID=2596912 RepID=UPI0016297997|nr:FMN-binding protein [Glaciihabitans sp. INWT7]QNE46731.1 FMN-binding protein [Glaciihabitans sp. INWT7]
MRTRATLSGIFASVAILVVGWQAGSAAVTAANGGPTASTTTSTGTSTGTSTTTAPAPSASAAPTTTAPAAAPATTAKSGTFTGSDVGTRFGNVQVKVVVADGKITDVTPLHLTDNGGRSVQISNYAAPILRSEVLSSQSSQVSTVGGATYTSEAYLTSLQSALDQAGI